jgi:hypothetical protein
MKSALRSALLSVTIGFCMEAAAQEPRPATPLEPPSLVVPVSGPVEASGRDAETPDIGIEGGGPVLACRPVYSRDPMQVGVPIGDPEKDSLGRVVERMECQGPG